MADSYVDDGIEQNLPSSSTTSSQSSRRFNLNEDSDRAILVYKLRSGYEISSQKELCRELDKGTEPFPNMLCRTRSTPLASKPSLSHSSSTSSEPAANEVTRVATDPRWRCSKKAIGRGTSRLDIKTCDLWTEPERTAYHRFPNAKSSVASVGLPRGVYWRRMFFGHFQDLYILSPESSPSSSVAASPDNTTDSSPDGPTPSSTFQATTDHT
ncbi:MAG: hypothetical protein M1828_006915 [Chrysothrix sp. TS-e1954]|nr:MAG: hypothetical protein M1828_006915 [Chrysothrix sp. TS-e1954]